MSPDWQKDIRLREGVRDGGNVWPVGAIPDQIILAISRQLVHRKSVGLADITGDDFGTIFANAIKGDHRSSPLGVADVVFNGCAWSVKTIQFKDPCQARGKVVRLISGRCSPDYSMGIENPHTDPSATGRAVLSIWNSRLNLAREQSDDIRVVVLIRNMNAQRFAIFEQPVTPAVADDYEWSFNKRKNLEGRHRGTGTHSFTWQPHGSQFTILHPVPPSARLFEIQRAIPMIEVEQVLQFAGYDDEWINILG